ncbi:uncharacterized, partial [Tachysurus ichikawai]
EPLGDQEALIEDMFLVKVDRNGIMRNEILSLVLTLSVEVGLLHICVTVLFLAGSRRATPAYLCCYDSFDHTLRLDRERSGWAAGLLYQYYHTVTDLPHRGNFASISLGPFEPRDMESSSYIHIYFLGSRPL